VRPRSIILFERVYWLNIVLAVAALAWTFARAGRWGLSMPADAAIGARSVAALTIAGLAILAITIKVLIWFFIARRASSVARWLFVIFFVLAIVSLIRTIGLYGRGMLPSLILLVVGVADTLLRIACLWLLFRADAAAWFRGRHSREELLDTFS